MKNIDKLAKELYNSNEKMELREFLDLTELERITLLIELKDMEDNKDLSREVFLDKYFNFSNNIQRYMKTVGAWDGAEKQWFRYIDKVMEYKELYPELNQVMNKEEILIIEEDIKEDIENMEDMEVEDGVKVIKTLLTEYTEKLFKKQQEDNLLENLKKIRSLDSIKNPQSEDDMPQLISSKIPKEAIEILVDFKKKYSLKKQEIITLALLEFKEKYNKFL